MPNVSSVIVETKQSILRPVVLDIVRQVMSITRIPANTPILYPDDIGKVAQPGSAITDNPLEKTIFPLNDKVFIEVSEDYDPSTILSTAVFQSEHNPIFLDKNIGVYIKPVYSSNLISINFRYKAKSKTAALKWRDDIRMRTSAGRDTNLHQVSYHYIVPKAFITILQEIHRLREKVDGYSESFPLYFQNNATKRLTEVTNLGATIVEPAISETQMRIVGMFDFESAPEKLEDEDDTNGWVGSFTYNFRFDKVIGCNMRYPVMIHNQILAPEYRYIDPAYNIDDQIQTNSLSFRGLSHFEIQLQASKYIKENENVVLPAYDEFLPSSIPSGTVSVFSALTAITQEDKRNLINLKDLGDIVIDEDIMEFIEKSEYTFMTKSYQSILQVNLYKATSLTGEGALTITNTMDVKSTTDLSLRTNHRVRFSIVANTDMLSKAALDRLAEYPKAFVKIIAAVNEALRNNPGFLDLINRAIIPREVVRSYLLDPNIRSQIIQFNTVQISEVIAYRRSALEE